ncbi:metalloprotease [Halostreptopolyspora alba]|uniref:Metalloprotease n=2 Tax=Halostreptopolyspora alba TaxID=2487137 RepID=A0A3N0E8D8_9ACTN|nr:metalloprotease [Nocardiopsaceae bacterium YIM 96095]
MLTWNLATGPTPGPESGPAAEPSGEPSEYGPRDLARPPTGEGGPRRPVGEGVLTANPLYDTDRLSSLPCPAPDLDVRSPESVTEFLNALTDCLDEAWAAQFRQAGLPYDPPRRVFWTEEGTSPCRDYPSAAGAFYCRADQSIYIGAADVVEKWNHTRESVVYASLLAHEYGHHVQGESGLLEHYHEQRRLEETPKERNAWTRKAELQANCFAGTFLGAVSVTYPITADDRAVVLADASATADPEDAPDEERTHGSAENGRYWLDQGMREQSPGACNTWNLPDDDSLVQ